MAGDRIELRGLRVLGVHGVLPEERERAQPFEVDLDVSVDTALALAGSTDELADTLDYGALVRIASAVVSDESHQLLERVAARIADGLLAFDDRVAEVTVTVRKLRPPVPVELATAAVTITRRR